MNENVIIKKAIVLNVDRIGGNFLTGPSKKSGVPEGLPMPRFTIQVRFVGDYQNIDKAKIVKSVEPLFDVHTFSIPEKGEIVTCISASLEEDAKWYYLCRENTKINSKNMFEEVKSIYKDHYIEEGRNIKEAMASGMEVDWIDNEYDKIPFPKYEHPLFRFKPGDVLQQGRSNTLVVHSFHGHRPLEKRKGYIELVTDRTYIYNNVKDHKNKFLEETDKQYDRWEFQNSEGSRILISGDVNVDRQLLNWFTEKEWVPAKSITDGGPNISRRFDAHYRDDGPSRLSTNMPDGDYPVIPNRTDPYQEHVADWKEPANEKDGSYYNDPLGVEIDDRSKDKKGIWDTLKQGEIPPSKDEKRKSGEGRGLWNNMKDTGFVDDKYILHDTLKAWTHKRIKDAHKLYKYMIGNHKERYEEFVPFDSQVPTVTIESERINLISRSGKDINHAVLGEELVRFLERLMMKVNYLARTVDLLRSRTATLALDFAQHTHESCPNGPPTPPTGGFRGTRGGTGADQVASPVHNIKNTVNNVIPTLVPEKVKGNDFEFFEEFGAGDAGPSNMAKPNLSVKVRLDQYFKMIDQSAAELADILSNRVSLN